MSKEAGEMGQELTLEGLAEKAKEIFLRDNFHPSMIYYSGSEGSHWTFAVPSREEMRDVGQDCRSEEDLAVGDLEKVFLVFRGFHGRLGERADLINEEDEGFRAIWLGEGKTIGFNPWAQNLKEVLAVVGADLATKKIEAVVSEIVRNAEGDVVDLRGIHRGPAQSPSLDAFLSGYAGSRPSLD